MTEFPNHTTLDRLCNWFCAEQTCAVRNLILHTNIVRCHIPAIDYLDVKGGRFANLNFLRNHFFHHHLWPLRSFLMAATGTANRFGSPTRLSKRFGRVLHIAPSLRWRL